MWPKGKTFNDAVVIGEKDEGLYKLKGQLEQALVKKKKELSELWHKRFAHIHNKASPIIRKMVTGLPELHAKHEALCKGCA